MSDEHLGRALAAQAIELAVSLALHWGVLILPDDKNVLVQNWRLVKGQPEGQEGIVQLIDRPEGTDPHVVMSDCTIQVDLTSPEATRDSCAALVGWLTEQVQASA